MRLQLSQEMKLKDNALDEIESVKLQMTEEHLSIIEKLKAENSDKVYQLSKQVQHSIVFPVFCCAYHYYGLVKHVGGF